MLILVESLLHGESGPVRVCGLSRVKIAEEGRFVRVALIVHLMLFLWWGRLVHHGRLRDAWLLEYVSVPSLVSLPLGIVVNGASYRQRIGIVGIKQVSGCSGEPASLYHFIHLVESFLYR